MKTNPRFLITYYTMNKRSGWLSSEQVKNNDVAFTRQELDVLVALIKDDNTIHKAFYVDNSNQKIEHIK